jgi:hypothetical protein
MQAFDHLPALSQGGLDFWFEQAIDFLAGQESCLLIASVSFSKSKRGLESDRRRSCRSDWCRPDVLDFSVLFVGPCFLLVQPLKH